MFDEILGNESVKKQLLQAFEKNSLPNTLLFYGPKGLGKSLFAIALAKMVLGKTDHRIESGNHPDLYQFFTEGKTRMHSIISMRSLTQQVFSSPFEAKEKIFIVHDAERMLPSASNALLKTLEEPLLDTHIILLSSSPDELLPTILSRCVKIAFSPIQEEEIYGFLINKEKFASSKAKELAKLAEGSLGRALAIAKDPKFEEKKETLLDLFLKRGINSYADFFNKIQKLESLYLEAEEEDNIIDPLFSQILLWERDIRLCALANIETLLHFPEAQSFSPPAFLPSFTKVESCLEEARTAHQRGLKLSTCLEYFFLKNA